MSDFYVGQKVRVTRDHVGEYGDEIKYKVGDILIVSNVDKDGYPAFECEKLKKGWCDAHEWTTPITTPDQEIELTQVRILGRLYNLVPVEG